MENMGESQQITGARVPPSVGRQEEGLEKPSGQVEGQEGRPPQWGTPWTEPGSRTRSTGRTLCWWGVVRGKPTSASAQLQKQSAGCRRARCRLCDPRRLHWLFQEQTWGSGGPVAARDTPRFLLGGVRGHLYRGGQITPPPQSRPGEAQMKGRQGAVVGRGALQGRRVQRLGVQTLHL